MGHTLCPVTRGDPKTSCPSCPGHTACKAGACRNGFCRARIGSQYLPCL